MDLKAIQQLLQEAQPILQKSKAEMKEREAKGEYFNVFENFEFEFCCSNFVSDETVIVNALKSAHAL